MGNRSGMYFFSATKAGAAGSGPASGPLRSRAAYTPATPGALLASVMSMLLIRACANGLRTKAACAAPWRVKSSMKWPWPVISRGSSRRWSLAPTSWVTAMSVASGGDRGLLARRAAHRPGGGLDGFDDVDVAGTPAEIAFEAPADLVFGGVRVLRKQVRGRHDEPWRAVATLQSVLVPERLLDRVELAILGQALDRLQALALCLNGKHRAALHRLAVDEDRARAALARVASDVCAGEPQVVAQVMHEQQARLDLMLVPAAVDGSRDLQLHTVLLNPLRWRRAAEPRVKRPLT